MPPHINNPTTAAPTKRQSTIARSMNIAIFRGYRLGINPRTFPAGSCAVPPYLEFGVPL
jgi:hypothetical protein